MSTSTTFVSLTSNSRRRSILGITLVLVLAIPAVRPLLGDGLLATDDGPFHLFRLMALDSALHTGTLYPRWFPDFAFGYGYPVLNFYSPASYYLAELFHIAGAGYILATKLMVVSTLLLSGLFMYLLVADILGRVPAVFSAIAYVYFPYHLADAFVRGAFPEFAAFAVFPAILWCLYRLFFSSHPLFWLAGTAVSAAMLVLMHNLSAFMFAPVLVGYVLLLAYSSRSRRSRLVMASLSLLLALGLSAFYWLPAITEVKWVQIGQEFGASTGYSKHLYSLWDYLSPFNLYRYSPDQGTIAEHPFGRIQILLLVLSFLVLPLAFRKERQAFLFVTFFLAVSAIAGIMLLNLSAPVWASVPVLPTLQYPWRLEALLTLSTAFLAGVIPYGLASLSVSRNANSGIRRLLAYSALPVTALFGIVLLLSGTANLPPSNPSLRESDITVEHMLSDDARVNQIGATWTAEFLPIFEKEERWRVPRSVSGSPTQVSSKVPAMPQLELKKADSSSWSFAIDSGVAQRLSLHAFYFPDWRVSIDGLPTSVYPAGSLGLVGFDIPQGQHDVKIEHGSTTSRDIGMLLALGSAIALVLIIVFGRAFRAGILVGLVLVVFGALSVAHFTPGSAAAFSPLDANLQNVAKLIGSEVADGSYCPGDRVKVKLFWLGWETLGKDYKVFVHLVSPEGGPPLAQHDGDTGGGFTPTSRWSTGELLTDEHEIALPDSLKPGIYRLEAGMYDPGTVRNVPIVGADGSSVGERVFLKEITVVAR